MNRCLQKHLHCVHALTTACISRRYRAIRKRPSDCRACMTFVDPSPERSTFPDHWSKRPLTGAHLPSSSTSESNYDSTVNID